MRVLVVEDEEPLGEVFRDFLAELGHDAVVVRSAEAALGTLQPVSYTHLTLPTNREV